ncbi:unnamed protein product [Ilex paraguariensis]|uniref:Uncharacterized protein n=1 Tax=Ilex paraguariensis TaxID=185542 RepID=A0ABC8R9J1_9AQUA
MNNKGRRNKSLCEESMLMVTNIVKLSSFSIIKTSRGKAAPQPATKDVASVTSSVKLVDLGSSRPSYLTELGEGDKSSYVVHEENNVDSQASDYIRKVHEKNRNDSNETLSLSPYIIPPPPRAVMQ